MPHLAERWDVSVIYDMCCPYMNHVHVLMSGHFNTRKMYVWTRSLLKTFKDVLYKSRQKWACTLQQHMTNHYEDCLAPVSLMWYFRLAGCSSLVEHIKLCSSIGISQCPQSVSMMQPSTLYRLLCKHFLRQSNSWAAFLLVKNKWNDKSHTQNVT